MNIKKGLIAGVAALGLSMSASAATINIGGVVWDPDTTVGFPNLVDFNSNGSIFEEAAVSAGDIVTGRGKFGRVNSVLNNEASFCPGCALTFTFSMELVGFTGGPATSGFGIDGAFTFKDLSINIFVDNAQDYDGTYASAAGGASWLTLYSSLLSGTGTNLGSGSDTGSGSSLLDVTGGMAASNFDTNGEAGGADMLLNSSFFDIQMPGTLGGTFDLRGDSIPEPTSIALLGLGLLGFAASRKRKA